MKLDYETMKNLSQCYTEIRKNVDNVSDIDLLELSDDQEKDITENYTKFDSDLSFMDIEYLIKTPRADGSWLGMRWMCLGRKIWLVVKVSIISPEMEIEHGTK